jgi:hypothetical protein
MIELKRILMELGNKLVTDHSFDPATGKVVAGRLSTHPIKAFTDWLNQTPQARQVLVNMGVSWPVSHDPTAIASVDDVCECLRALGPHVCGVIKGRFPSGMSGEGVSVSCTRFGSFVFFIGGRKWQYEDYDGEGDRREVKETYMADSASPETVAKFIDNLVKKREGRA